MDTVAKLEAELRRSEENHTRIYVALMEARAAKAKQFEHAANKRRGNVVDLPTDPVARAIVMAGRKRRNED
jgi:hypothetical protein